MKCIECKKEMKLVNKQKVKLNDYGGCYFINEYDCENCGIKIFMDTGIANYGITKLYLPPNLKPTEKQLEFADFIVTYLPELKYYRESFYTKRQLSKFISMYKDIAIKAKEDKINLSKQRVAKLISKNRKIRRK